MEKIFYPSMSLEDCPTELLPNFLDTEFDDEYVDATYFIAQYKNIFVGTARYRLTDFGIKLERFAVLKSYRNLGVGKRLALYILNSIKDEKVIYLHAQESVIDFYLKLGFKRIGSQFFEAEILHQKMIYNPRHR